VKYLLTLIYMQQQTLAHLGAFESTKIHGSGRDVLSTTHHIERWHYDLSLLLAAGITELRYPIPWHRIERLHGEYDFRWLDGPMRFMEQNGMRPIVDPLHHTSFPDWLEGGFSNPLFPGLYVSFLTKVLNRYPWIDRLTVFNEPLATTVLCSVMGVWYPYQSSDLEFTRMALQVSKAICLGSQLVRARNPEIQLVRVDTCEYHHALDCESEPWTAFCNERRFLYDDLVTGRIDNLHPLYSYLTANGIRPDELQWFRDNPAGVDIIGLDYYPPSEMDWQWNVNTQSAHLAWPVSAPRGFASVARDYSAKYQKPIMLTETNIRGTVSDRITWLKHMEEQCELLLLDGVDLTGFCWFPSIDSTDWDQLCTSCNSSVDPQGIWWLDESRWSRNASELSSWYSQLALGQVTSAALPAYRFIAPLDRDLAGHMKLMKHWDTWVAAGGLAA